jgi:predicted nuclease of restriction endonuclease-like (RecB) superfamily
MSSDRTNFAWLVTSIARTHALFAAQASRAINVSLTLRNWLIGHHIAEYELQGADRADYGARLLERLAQQLGEAGLRRIDARELRRFRQFYGAYPQIREAVTPVLASLPVAQRLGLPEIRESVTPEFASVALAGTGKPPAVDPRQLLDRLSFTHFAELVQIDEPLKRLFYEVETLRGNWSVRELKRQIATQYFERSGLSTDKDALARLTHSHAEAQSPQHVIRDPYVFEFLGLRAQEVMTERKLEDALLDRLQQFLIELGHGFCFEARQKRVLIGGEHGFIDLVFYHRVLKCHVLVELKNDAFRHEHLGQLNAYVGYYQQHEMTKGDQLPVGILLCTQKNHEMVQYALAGMTNKLFVSRYQLALPAASEMEAFLRRALGELGVDEGGGGG